jgi:hypothetical protein
MKKMVIILVIALAFVVAAEASPDPFVSPVPWCAPGVPQPCLPWRPTPPAKEQKDKPLGVSAEMLKRGECIARARAWMVDASICEK